MRFQIPRHRRFVGWFLCVVLMGALPGALAQAETPETDSSKKAAARAKLVDGSDLLHRGEFPQALAAFSEAYSLFPSPKIQYDLGLAYQGLGRNAEALNAFEVFLRDVPDARPDMRAKAQANRDSLLLQVATLRVTAEVDGASILIDGREIGKTPYLKDIRLDLGPHLLLVDRGDGAPPFTQRLELAPGASVSVVASFPKSGIALSARAPAGGSSAAGADLTPTAHRDSPAWLRPAAWTTGGLALAGLVTGIVGLAVKESKYTAFNDNKGCDKAFPDAGGPDCRDLLSAGDSAKTIAIAGFVSAGAFGAVSAVMFFWDRRSQAQDPGATKLSLTCGPGLCGLQF